jgi:hypothetical protein
MSDLPGEVTEEEWGLPEGDWHFHAKKGALEALRTAFAEVLRRKAYVAADLPVYYPNARRFAPDLLVVLEVEPYFRNKWDVNWEKRLVPQRGRYHSERLGVDLVVEEGRLRFYIGDTLLLEFEELVAQLRQETQQWKARALEEERRRKAAEQARDEEARRRQQAEEENARLKEENARLKALLH